MQDSQWEELISAYHDGELSNEERALVETRLGESAVARQQLDDFSGMSETLKSLPIGEPPADLEQSIWHRIERESLLSRRTVSPKGRLRREWMVVPAGLLATVAGVMAILSAQWQHPPTSSLDETSSFAALEVRPEMTAESTVSFSMASEGAADFDEAVVASAETKADFGASVTSMPSTSERPYVTKDLAEVSGRLEERRLSQRPVADVKEFPDGLMAELPLDNIAEREATNGWGLAEGISPTRNWSGVRIGDMVPYLVDGQDQVAVVELTVVDVIQAAGETEILLARNGISPISEDADALDFSYQSDDLAKSREAKAAEPQGVTESNLSNFLCVYVEAEPQQMAEALNELQQQNFVVSTGLQPPIKVSTEGRLAADQLGDRSLERIAFEQSLTERYVAAAMTLRTQAVAQVTSEFATTQMAGEEPQAIGGSAANRTAGEAASDKEKAKAGGTVASAPMRQSMAGKAESVPIAREDRAARSLEHESRQQRDQTEGEATGRFDRGEMQAKRMRKGYQNQFSVPGASDGPLASLDRTSAEFTASPSDAPTPVAAGTRRRLHEFYGDLNRTFFNRVDARTYWSNAGTAERDSANPDAVRVVILVQRIPDAVPGNPPASRRSSVAE